MEKIGNKRADHISLTTYKYAEENNFNQISSEYFNYTLYTQLPTPYEVAVAHPNTFCV
jgi:hypothetical protein